MALRAVATSKSVLDQTPHAEIIFEAQRFASWTKPSQVVGYCRCLLTFPGNYSSEIRIDTCW